MTDPTAAADEQDPSASHVERVIRERRTSLLVDAERPVPEGLIDRLIDAANQAPNHKRTWPWRFTVLTGAARGRLGRTMAEDGAGLDLEAPKLAKLPTKYERSAAVVLVWVQVHGDEVRRREDRDATAAAVQNLLLAATAHGLGSHWASVPDALVPAVRRVAEVGDDHDLVALVYLGWPTGTAPPPERPDPTVTRLS